MAPLFRGSRTIIPTFTKTQSQTCFGVNAKTKFQVMRIWIDGLNGKMRWLDIEEEPKTKIDWNYVKSSFHLCS
jgi:hypothetical protein